MSGQRYSDEHKDTVSEGLEQKTSKDPVRGCFDEEEELAYKSVVKECLKFEDADVEDVKVEEYMENLTKEKFKEIVHENINLKNEFYMKMKVYNDPIHGSIQLNALEDAIVNTPEFYRLREIKQLGGKSHVFPGAVHTRFEHSIGVCHLAGKFMTHLRQISSPIAIRRIPEGATAIQALHFRNIDAVDLGRQEDICVRLAGLCHDLGHGPYSHLFEEVSKKILGETYKFGHEKISVMIFKRILLKHDKVMVMFVKCGLTGEHVRMIQDMICPGDVLPPGKRPRRSCRGDFKRSWDPKEIYLYEIVANKKSGMDVDKWDYFARDCHYLGLKNEFDFERSIALSSIVCDGEENHVGFRDKEKSNIYGLFRTRCVLYQKAYNHKTADGIDMMIMDALVEAKDIPLQLPQPDKWPGHSTDVTLTQILHDMTMNKLGGYILLTDSILSTFMLSRASVEKESESLRKVQDIIRRITERDIYRSICENSVYKKPKDFGKDFKVKKPEDFETDFEVKTFKIKYASEMSEDPVVDDVFFFSKETSTEKIPPSIKRDHDGCSSDAEGSTTKRMKKESLLNLPKSFTEYQRRLYSKNPRSLTTPERKNKVERFQKIYCKC